MNYRDWSMFTRNWSFETAGCSREGIESIDPLSTTPEVLEGVFGEVQSTKSTNVQQSLARSHVALVPVVKKEQSQKDSATISCHPAIKYVNHSLIVVLNFAPNIGQKSTDIASLVAILPQYAAITTFIHLSIRDVPLVRDTFENYCKRMESINSVVSVLEKFDKIEHFQTQVIGGNSVVPLKSSCVGDGDNGEPTKYTERRSAIGARLRQLWRSEFCKALDQEERDRTNKFWSALE
ncbi:a7e6a567-6442-430a-9f9a-2f7919bb0701-CDS [Sclerotinia trifoliorum]|uniref:A7e6a567-6442-430a-9f9a-2f7919bb0701-CDS n=1 Tax=Sclerotinia trifoliorum TaxID=28548 RepID=A0A8H2VW99_9HELO|nr:a7e6a567-6442-430a-9f9a-2f7919bb0701-CDS [Sclerotinia trifoliorum]